jgi:hypothetical protein
MGPYQFIIQKASSISGSKLVKNKDIRISKKLFDLQLWSELNLFLLNLANSENTPRDFFLDSWVIEFRKNRKKATLVAFASCIQRTGVHIWSENMKDGSPKIPHGTERRGPDANLKLLLTRARVYMACILGGVFSEELTQLLIYVQLA